MEAWNGKDLSTDPEKIWGITLKADGVQAIFKDGKVTSRRGKPLYNLDKYAKQGYEGIYEVYLGDFKSSTQAVRTKKRLIDIPESALYKLEPEIDERLFHDFTTEDKLTADKINIFLATVQAEGWEGLVLRSGEDRLKVKPYETHDVVILDIIEGSGRNVGRMGALVTEKGKVGTGFSDKEREELFKKKYIGETIEVKCMHLTEFGKFRHPSFERLRWDK